MRFGIGDLFSIVDSDLDGTLIGMHSVETTMTMVHTWGSTTSALAGVWQSNETDQNVRCWWQGRLVPVQIGMPSGHFAKPAELSESWSCTSLHLRPTVNPLVWFGLVKYLLEFRSDFFNLFPKGYCFRMDSGENALIPVVGDFFY